MSRERRRYLSYLLRLWQTRDEGVWIWRASLESSSTGERRGFASLAEMYAFLEGEIARVDEDGHVAPEDDQGKT